MFPSNTQKKTVVAGQSRPELQYRIKPTAIPGGVSADSAVDSAAGSAGGSVVSPAAAAADVAFLLEEGKPRSIRKQVRALFEGRRFSFAASRRLPSVKPLEWFQRSQRLTLIM